MNRAPSIGSMVRSHFVEPREVQVPHVLRLVRNAAAFAVSYAAADRFTDVVFSTAELPPGLFLPSALVLTALLLTPPVRWWAVLASTLVGQWIGSFGEGISVVTILESFTIDAASTVLAAVFIRRFVDLSSALGTLRDIAVFAVIAVLAPIVGLLGSATLFHIRTPVELTGAQPGGTMMWMAWFVAALGDAIAYMTVVPVGLATHVAVRNAFAAESRAVLRWTRLIEALLLGAAAGLVSALLFAHSPGSRIVWAIALCAAVPLMLYAALRFGLAGAASVLFIGACIAMREALHGAVIIPAPSPAAGVVVQQLAFLAVASPFLFLAAVLDERRHVSIQLAQSDARYALATQAGRTFVYSYDASSEAVAVDAPLPEALGVTPFELASPTWWWRHVHPDDVAPLQRAWGSRLGRGTPAVPAGPTDFRMLDHDGRVRWFRDRPAFRHFAEPDSAPLVGTVTDITELKTAETTAAQRSRELAHVARTSIVGELAAALAHEIRQPLTAILINSQTAMRVLDAQFRDPEAVREILHQLAADGRRASEVIQRIRAFAKKGDVERGPLDLNAMLREAVQLVRHDTIRRRVEIRFALTHESLIVVGDRVQLQQVALNLVLNALEALADRPPDSERLVLIETARAATHTAIITIRDTGPGIAPERQAAIFEPFITSKPNGLGVGLSISRTIVEAHGGVIWCESDPAVGGAAFIVAIPLGNARRS
jgi:two-component system, LuxR family, sensor kinase FixL